VVAVEAVGAVRELVAGKVEVEGHPEAFAWSRSSARDMSP